MQLTDGTEAGKNGTQQREEDSGLLGVSMQPLKDLQHGDKSLKNCHESARRKKYKKFGPNKLLKNCHESARRTKYKKFGPFCESIFVYQKGF